MEPLGLTDSAVALSTNFTTIDWAVMIGYLAIVSYLGVRLAGKQESMEDFFRGGNRLPWYAVSGSMIATIISAVTFVAVPSIVYKDGGNFTYLQFGIIAGLISRLFVAYVLIPAYFKNQVYSPYDYMGDQLGESTRSVTTALFSVLGVLAQAARVYLTAIILMLVLESQLNWLSSATGISALALSVIIVGAIAVIWTMMGGIATVIWTDVLLFLLFVSGGLVAIGVMVASLPDGLAGLIREGSAAGKFQLWEWSNSADVAGRFRSPWAAHLTQPYTLWAAFFAVTISNIGTYGTDQLLAQRIFTCRSEKDAKLAVVASWLAELVAALMLLVGVGLWAFYRAFPDQLTGAAAAAVEAKTDNVFPVFILTQVPVALRGLIVAGIFAAAISSLTSILAALSQTTLSAVYLPWKGWRTDQPLSTEQNRHVLSVSRLLIVAWGIALCAVAIAIDRYVTSQKGLGNEIFFLDLALGIANYITGTLFAAFLLAWIPHGRDGYGLIWSAPLSVFCVVATKFHDPRTFGLCVVIAIVLVATWLAAAMFAHSPELRRQRLWKTVWLLLGCGLMLLICDRLWFAEFVPGTEELLTRDNGEIVKNSIAYPWYAPIGSFVAFIFGLALGDPKKPHVAE